MNSSLFNNLNKLKNNKNNSQKNNKKNNSNKSKNNSNKSKNNFNMIKMNNNILKTNNNSSKNVLNIVETNKQSNTYLNSNKNSNTRNNDDMFMGISNNVISNNSTKNSENVLVKHINEVQGDIEQKFNNSGNKQGLNVKNNSGFNKSNKVKNMNFENPKTKNVVVGIINGLEQDVDKLSAEIKEFNNKNKELCELDKKEVERLRGIIRKLYTLILTIYRSVEHKNEKSIDILEQLRASIEGNEAFLRNIDEIVAKGNSNRNGMNHNFKNNFLVNEANVPNNRKKNLSILNIMNKQNMEQEFEGLEEKPANNQKKNNATGFMNVFGMGETPNQTPVAEPTNQVQQEEVELVENEIVNSSPNKQRRRLRAKNIAQKIESTSINNSEAKNRLNKYLL